MGGNVRLMLIRHDIEEIDAIGGFDNSCPTLEYMESRSIALTEMCCSMVGFIVARRCAVRVARINKTGSMDVP